MKIAIASGKGGTGKTSFSVVLSHFIAHTKKTPIIYYDCDCEAPNAHLFFGDISLEPVRQVTISTPKIDLNKCTFCGKCKAICRFNAITILTNKVALTFPELCHGCKGCFRVCEAQAIEEQPRILGEVVKGAAGNQVPIELVQGRLRIGEAMSPPLIRAVLEEGGKDPIQNRTPVEIIDSPPGTSCPVVATICGSDLAVLVTEATPFGLHDLEIMIKVTEKLKVQFVVVANKVFSGQGDIVSRYCRERGHAYVGGLPFSQDFAQQYARGGDIYGLVKDDPHYKEVLCRIAGLIQEK